MGSPWPEDRSAVEIAATVTTNEPRINDRIRAREVRLVDPDGEQLGIKSLTDALNLAREQDLDLVEVAPLANPPVARIMDYGKFKFDAAQRAKESKRKAVHVGIKEMKYRPKIGPGDFDTKTRQVAKFLEEGHKVKITIMFRGREVFHPELGKKILDRIAEQMEGMGKSESDPRLDGRNMVMVLAPDKRAKQSAASRGPKSGGNPANGSTPEVAPVAKAAAPVAPAEASEASAPAAAAAPAAAEAKAAEPASDGTEAVATVATPETAAEPAPAEEKIEEKG
ncbi:MAG TPA: translation initiation factor IF-3 [Acidimicrobiales bacterium]|jgi:translation initiation factor IF-3|nr:translation initiation factor IF-3 [Acidimicrobiales bacterium]